MGLATLRWTLEGRKLKLAGGDTYTFPKRTPKPILDALAALPQDYLELGNASADLSEDLRDKTREAEGWRMQFEDLMVKIGSTDDKDPQRLLVILQKDLETALNLASRLIWSLGAQPGGGLYDSVNALMRKYGMALTPNTGMRDVQSPYIEAGDATVDEEGERYVDIPNVATVKVNFTTGKLDITPVEEPDTDRWDDEGGNGGNRGNREWLRD
jgi:hypothetical protein